MTPTVVFAVGQVAAGQVVAGQVVAGQVVAGQVAAGQVATGQVAVGENLLVDLVRVLVLTVMAAFLGAVLGLVHRWYANQRVPDGLAVLVGVSGVALYLNTAGALGDVIVGQVDLLALEAAIFNVVTFFVGGAAAVGGGRVGDRVGVSLFAVAGGKTVQTDVSRIVKTVGRVTTVEIPDEVGDIDGYDPVDPATKEKLAGQTLLFPRRLTLEELRDRFVQRLRTDYGVGHVDVDFGADGAVEYLAVGSREAGIGPTLPPATAAVAVKADPANSASPGDTVQVWTAGTGMQPEAGIQSVAGIRAETENQPETEGGAEVDAEVDADAEAEADAGSESTDVPETDADDVPASSAAGAGGVRPRRVTNAELRGTADDVVTLAMDEEEAVALDTETRYRLVTLPDEPRIDREFASQLRAAAETMGVVTVAEGSQLAGNPVSALDVAVAAVRTVDGEIEATPPRTRTLSAGETVYAIARPDRLRRLEATGAGEDGAKSAEPTTSG